MVFVKPLEHSAFLPSLTPLTFVAHIQKPLTPAELKSSGTLKSTEGGRLKGGIRGQLKMLLFEHTSLLSSYITFIEGCCMCRQRRTGMPWQKLCTHALSHGWLITSIRVQTLDKILHVFLGFLTSLVLRTLLSTHLNNSASTTQMRSCINSLTTMCLHWSRK